jgi:hypothetical protein
VGSTIGAVARPPEDFNNDPTRYRDAGKGDRPASGEPPPAPNQFEQPPAPNPVEPQLDPFDDETEPTPWYRKPVGLIIWGLSVLILIALIVYGIIQLVEDQGAGTTPKTTTTTPHSTTTTTTTPTTTSPSAATTTPTTTEPPTSSAEPQEPQPTHQPTQQQPTHRHHWPSWLPTTIPALP